ncbi:lipopolysaccharide biosynthesis protein [Sphaerotilus sp.]|uniref:lipopolysaccharide biosynthesis protein n=1 Tax=Sphaerotilus sp. TaxID=2093942 RepID=UPI002ACEB64E|nr:oligosaccharide flippase family protein [Sphaerotilus sp.]MDZ7855408.1 oligosaccharide flippase family protein [Sphaerotilus sp.]
MIRPFLLSLGTSVGMAGLGFATNVVLARMLAPQARGELAAVMLAAMLIAGVAQWGLGPAYVYTVRSRDVSRPRRLAGIGALLIIATAALLSLGWHGVQFSHNPASVPLTLLAGCAIAQALQLYVSSLSQARDGLHLFNLLRAVPTAFVFAGTVTLAMTGGLHPHTAALVYALGFGAAGALYVAATTVGTAAPHTNTNTSPNETSAFRLGHHVRYSLQYHSTVLLGMLATNVDKLYLSFSASAASLGVYTVAYATSRLINVVQEAAANALFSRYAGRSAAGMSDGVARVFRLTFYPMLLTCGLIAGLSWPLFGKVFGPAYQAGWLPFVILLVECVVGGASWLLAQRFAAAGQTATVAARQVISLLPVACALPWLRPSHLAVDMALVMLASSLLRLLVTVQFLHRRAGLPVGALLLRRTDLDFMMTLLPLPRGLRP